MFYVFCVFFWFCLVSRLRKLCRSCGDLEVVFVCLFVCLFVCF